VQKNIQEVLEEDGEFSVVDQRLVMRHSSAFNPLSQLNEPRNLFQKSDSNDSAPDKELPNLDS